MTTECAQKNKNFALIGAAGYIAPKHFEAIKTTGNNLIAILDPCDSVGIIDRYFPDADYFREFERFDRHIEKLKRTNDENRVHFISVCSPNYLHDAHLRFALRVGADAICEKPLVLNPWNLDLLSSVEEETKKKINTILQLRLHPEIIALKTRLSREEKNQQPSPIRHKVDLTYVTPRGSWYSYSWKGDEEKSGGVATNIGIHFFDMLLWVFGEMRDYRIEFNNQSKVSGWLDLERADVTWKLSIDKNDLFSDKINQAPPYKANRSLFINNEKWDFSDSFTNLHVLSYQKILEDKGFGIEDIRPAIELVYKIRNSKEKKNAKRVFCS
ncbi:MAG: Gfo/Idh/MocA family oxidoreductase [Oligoflexia bacterium]|nr:Gfo/Idh/MocA family oxidoreductase [Oligoflexia bacterium]